MKRIRNYYCATTTITLDDGTSRHVGPGMNTRVTEAEAERFLKDASNRFELMKEPKPKKGSDE